MHKTILYTAVAASAGLSGAAPLASEHHSDSLETFVVVASRTETPLRTLGTSVAVMDADDLALRGFVSLSDALRSLPSVSVSNSGGPGKVTTLRVRGEAGFRTLTLVDGLDITDPTGTQACAQVQHLLGADVSRVELLRGPQGMMYGADAGGVVRISTGRDGEGLYGGASGEAGRYNTRVFSGHLGGANRQGDFYLSAARAATDGFNAYQGDASGDPDGYDNTTLHGRAAWNIGDQWRLGGVVRDTDAEVEYDRCGWPTIHDCRELFQQRSHRIFVSHSIQEGEHTLAYAATEVERRLYDADVLSVEYEGEIERWELTGHRALSDDLRLTYGLEDRTDRVSDDQRGQRAGWLEYQGRHLEQLYVTAGLRHDRNDDFGRNTSYRLSGAWLQPLGAGVIKFKSALGTGFRAPSLFEIQYNRRDNAPEMAPLAQEDSRGLDVGVEYFTDSGLHLEAVLFDQRIDNEIFFDMVAFSGYLQDDQSSRSRGVELIGSVPLHPTLTLHANFTYTRAELESGDPRPRVPKQLANLGLVYVPLEALTLGLNLRAARDMLEAGSGDPLDNYQVLDATVRYGVRDNLVVYVRGENVLDADYQEVSGYNTSGAAAYGGVEFRF